MVFVPKAIPLLPVTKADVPTAKALSILSKLVCGSDFAPLPITILFSPRLIAC